MEARKKFFMDCHLAGRKFHDADEVWDKLKVGTELHLEHEPNNPHDPNAVAVGYYDEEQDEKHNKWPAYDYLKDLHLNIMEAQNES